MNRGFFAKAAVAISIVSLTATFVASGPAFGATKVKLIWMVQRKIFLDGEITNANSISPIKQLYLEVKLAAFQLSQRDPAKVINRFVITVLAIGCLLELQLQIKSHFNMD